MRCGNRYRGSKTICSVCANGSRNPTTSGVEDEPKDSLHQKDSITNRNAPVQGEEVDTLE